MPHLDHLWTLGLSDWSAGERGWELASQRASHKLGTREVKSQRIVQSTPRGLADGVTSPTTKPCLSWDGVGVPPEAQPSSALNSTWRLPRPAVLKPPGRQAGTEGRALGGHFSKASLPSFVRVLASPGLYPCPAQTPSYSSVTHRAATPTNSFFIWF